MNPDIEQESFSFADLGLKPDLLSVLARLGHSEPTPIQREAIPMLIKGGDVLAQAATGTGKTAAFGLPILQQLDDSRRAKNPVALILAPTRELAIQVAEALETYGKEIGARIVAVYGGQPIYKQMQPLSRGVDVVVATPGRAIDHIKRGTLDLSNIETVVLDEADEMLDMGFADEIEQILESVTTDHQTALFSATLPPRIDSIARKYLKDPDRIRIERPKLAENEQPKVRQISYVVARQHKASTIGRILDMETAPAAIVFCRTRDQVDSLTATLNERGHRCEAIHGGLTQEQRDRVMGRVRTRATELLVATDVAARGLDIDHLTHVINFDVPTSPETYVHRIGRVGRAGREGIAITLTDPRDQRMLRNVERVTKQTIAIERIPTVADLRARRVDSLRSAVEEQLADENTTNRFRKVVESLSADHDIVDIAAAALAVAQQSVSVNEDDFDIPESSFDKPKFDRNKRDFKDGPKGRKPFGKDKGGRGTGEPMTRIFIGVGRAAKVRPQDLVGAIANEANISGRQIGAIDITEKFSLVEVPVAAAENVINSMRRTTIKGQKTVVRRDKNS